MGAATVKYEGSVRDTAAIIAAVGTIAATTLIIIPTGNGTGVTILEQGS